MRDTVVYTAWLASRDAELWSPPDIDADFVCFTERPRGPAGWQLRQPQEVSNDPGLTARYHKALPHVVLPQYQRWIWCDASVRLVQLPDSPHGVCAHRHRRRTHWEHELAVCLRTSRLPLVAALKQHAAYYGGASAPLCETGFLDRVATEAVRRFNTYWWQQLWQYSARDQISFGYAVVQADVPFAQLPQPLTASPYVRLRPHRYEPHMACQQNAYGQDFSNYREHYLQLHERWVRWVKQRRWSSEPAVAGRHS